MNAVKGSAGSSPCRFRQCFVWCNGSTPPFKWGRPRFKPLGIANMSPAMDIRRNFRYQRLLDKWSFLVYRTTLNTEDWQRGRSRWFAKPQDVTVPQVRILYLPPCFSGRVGQGAGLKTPTSQFESVGKHQWVFGCWQSHRSFKPRFEGSIPSGLSMALSSNGRTRGSQPRNRGSLPRGATKLEIVPALGADRS